jgi:hypothetical protein
LWGKSGAHRSQHKNWGAARLRQLAEDGLPLGRSQVAVYSLCSTGNSQMVFIMGLAWQKESLRYLTINRYNDVEPIIIIIIMMAKILQGYHIIFH